MSKLYLTDDQIKKGVHDILRQMSADNWRPDYIVGITRGGLIPAVLMSHYTGMRMETIDVRLRDSENSPEHALWMAEDAYGYEPNDYYDPAMGHNKTSVDKRKNILILDDINDTGATFNWIKQDWQASCLPHATDGWNTVWHSNVRFATITDNLSSEFNGKVDYSTHEVNKAEEDVWLVYPWENVGK